MRLDFASKRYWRGQHPIDVLTDVSLELEPGEVAAVWGARGSGKSTLLEIVAGIQEPDAGSVWFDGDKLVGQHLAEIGVATREGPSSWDLPVGDWVALALIDRVGAGPAGRRANETLHRLGVRDVSSASWDFLSDGERRLVSIAHAIIQEPRVLLVDDLTAGLDLLERAEIMRLLQSLAGDQGMSVLVTASDLAEVQGARPIWALGGGKLIGERRATGTVVKLPFGRE